MDFLTDYLGEDVFSILHKYIGDIIEELSCDRTDFCDLPFDAKLILKNAIKNGSSCGTCSQINNIRMNDLAFICSNDTLFPYNKKLDVIKIKINNIPHTVYRLYGLYIEDRNIHLYRNYLNSCIVINEVDKSLFHVNAFLMERGEISDGFSQWYCRR